MTEVDALKAETAALRTGAGAFRSARDVLAVRGPDAVDYLQGQLSQDVAGLAVGASADSLLLEPDGKLSALLRVTRTDGQGFVLDVEAGFGNAVSARLQRFRLRAKVEIDASRLALPLALRGDAVAELAGGLLTGPRRNGASSRCPSNGTAGAASTCSGRPTWCSGPRTRNCHPGSWRAGPPRQKACRIVSGIPAMGAEITAKTIPHETGVVERTVSFTKGCYTGQRAGGPDRLRGATCRAASLAWWRPPSRRSPAS